jgi:hypothetical protein
MAARIENVVVGWTIDTPDGPRHAAIDLASMRRHARSERVEDLLDDLAVICEDVTRARGVSDDRGQLRRIK